MNENGIDNSGLNPDPKERVPGGKAAAERVAHLRQPMIGALMRGGGISLQDAEDIVSEVTVHAMKLDASENFSDPYFYLVAKRSAQTLKRDRGRRGGKLAEREQELEPRGPKSPELAAEHMKLRQRLDSVLDSLSPEDAEILTLRAFDQLRYQEISETLGIPINIVKSSLRRARARLRELLADSDLEKEWQE